MTHTLARERNGASDVLVRSEIAHRLVESEPRSGIEAVVRQHCREIYSALIAHSFEQFSDGPIDVRLIV